MYRPLVLVGFASFLIAQPVSGQLIPGNLAVYRVGNGAAALGSGATASFVDQFDTTTIGQTPINSVTIDNSGVNRLTNSGSATSEGFLVRSTNGLFLSFGGYDADAGTAGVATSLSTAIQRVGGRINGDATYTRVGSFGTTAFNGGNIRGVVSDGFNYWGSGTSTGTGSPNGGAWHLGTQTQVSSTVGNIRVANIFSDQLYFTSGSGTRGIYAVGTGTPTSGSITSTLVFSTGGANASPYSFQANTAGNVVYVADDASVANGGGIQKWTFNGTTWVLGATLQTPSRGLAVDWSDPNNVVLYATTTGNALIRFTDNGTFSATSTLATAGTNTAFRSVELAMVPATWTSNVSANFRVTNTSTSGFGNQYSNWSVGLANGINLAFQKVNASAITAFNNSGLNGVSSITFTGTGFGSQNTQYTLTGNGIFLTGTTTTGQGVANYSGVTQTVNLDLSVSGPQTFNAASGDLAFGGSLSLFTNTLTVTGPSNTTISGVVSGGFGGSIFKTGTGTLTLSNTNTYDGGTTINGGTVVASATNATGTGATTINNGGTLRSSATLAEIVVNSGGRIAPGSSPGTLNTGKGTLNGGGTFEFEINDATGVAGTNWDLWNVNGNDGLTINATSGNQFIIDIPDPQTVANFNPASNYSWEFLTFKGAIQGAGFDPNAFNVLFGGPFAGNGTFSVSQVGQSLFLNFTAAPVPEPSTMLLIGAVGAAFVVLRRRGKT